ncbi:TPA: GNAT family N-acetyltransferase [Legionella pneumophila]
MQYQAELVIDVEQLNQQDKFIREGIVTFNAPFIGSKPDRYSIYVKDNDGTIIGGAIVFAHNSSIYIDVLWVADNFRGIGIGSEILAKIESETIKRGIPASTVDTFSFQAETFYIKQGYQQIGTIQNYIEGHDRIYLRKLLIK